MNVFIDIDIFKSDLIDIDIFKTCRYIDNRYGLSIYRTPLDARDIIWNTPCWWAKASLFVLVIPWPVVRGGTSTCARGMYVKWVPQHLLAICWIWESRHFLLYFWASTSKNFTVHAKGDTTWELQSKVQFPTLKTNLSDFSRRLTLSTPQPHTTTQPCSVPFCPS